MPGQDQDLQRVSACQALPRRRVGGTWHLPAPAVPQLCHCRWVQGDTSPAWSCCHFWGAQLLREEERGTLGAGAAWALLWALQESLCSQGMLLLEERPLPTGRCWWQPGKDQACHQRVCVGGLIFVCRSQMVKEESDIISRAGAMKRGRVKVTGGIETPGPPSYGVCWPFSSASCRDPSWAALGIAPTFRHLSFLPVATQGS